MTNHAARQLPLPDELRALFDYNQKTGVLRWRWRAGEHQGAKMFNTRYAGKEAGAIFTGAHGTQYRVVGLEGKTHYVHRIIWKWMTGEDPPEILDHKDRNGINNSWRNLRAATINQNAYNSVARSHNTSALKGVRRSPAKSERWTARIVVAGKSLHLGCFPTREEAAAAYRRAALEHHGAFARQF